MRPGHQSTPVRTAAAAVMALVCAILPVSGAQELRLRSSVDLIVADVQIVDNDGRPVTGLTADRFEVSIDGKKVRVAIADFISVRTQTATTAPVVGTALPPPPATQVPAEPAGSNVFLVAVDSLSFTAAQSSAVMKAARTFVDRLQPGDLVGLFTYPTGPQLNPTTDHAAIVSALQKVTGAREPTPTGRFVLRPTEIVDLAASGPGGRGDQAVTQVVARECGTDPNCISQLLTEARNAAQSVEAAAFVSLGGLRNLLQGVRSIPGRKTMVLVTAGMVTSDRAGGHPDLSDISRLAGQDAERSNVTVYTVFVDQEAMTATSPERRSGAANRFTSNARDSEAMSQWFSQFSATAGGTLIRDQMGSGEIGFDRILAETSAYYRLGIEPTDAIRDGRPHQLKVTVNEKRVTVRGRKWVVVPAK